MINYNGTIQEKDTITLNNNRGFLFGDSVFETLKVIDTTVLFLEDHYFRLMASMRICRMEIPMNFTMEFFEEEIVKLITSYPNQHIHRVRFTVFRNAEGLYLPKNNTISYLVTSSFLNDRLYPYSDTSKEYEVELFKDAYITKQLFSTIKTNNKMIQVVGSIFAKENNYANCLLLNDEKNVVEALQSNIFLKKGNTISTPPLSDGCLNGIMRKQLLAIIKKTPEITLEERSISPFELQKSDELFLTNTIVGIQSVTKYRKKEFESNIAPILIKKLNAQILLTLQS